MAYVEYADSTRTTATNGNWTAHFFVSVIRSLLPLLDIFRRLLGWRPTAYEHLHVDRMGHLASVEPQQAIRRSLSFRARALLHQLFTGDGFHEPQAVGTA